MVWIYGGGFGVGTTADPVCSGENLAKKDVVVVSLTYRVGLLGFFGASRIEVLKIQTMFQGITDYSIRLPG